MYIVTWTKVFTKGYLAGTTYNTQLSFSNLVSAESHLNFLKEHEAKPVEGLGSPYLVFNPILIDARAVDLQ